MRAVLAKRLRRTARNLAPINPSLVSTYAPMPRTGRERTGVQPQLQANGTISMVKVAVKTVTFRLAPDCARYFTQKYKRAFTKKGIH